MNGLAIPSVLVGAGVGALSSKSFGVPLPLVFVIYLCVLVILPFFAAQSQEKGTLGKVGMCEWVLDLDG